MGLPLTKNATSKEDAPLPEMVKTPKLNMKSVRFDSDKDPKLTIARIDEILQKGDLDEYLRFLPALIAQPNGETALNMEKLFHSVNKADPEFNSLEQFLAAYHLILALRQFAPHHQCSQSPQPG